MPLPVKPQGFPKWLGRIVGGLLLLAALAIAVGYFSGSDSQSTPESVPSSNPFK